MKPIEILKRLGVDNNTVIALSEDGQCMFKVIPGKLVGQNMVDLRLEWELTMFAIRSVEEGDWITADTINDDAKYQWVNQYVVVEDLKEALKSYGYKYYEGSMPSIREVK